MAELTTDPRQMGWSLCIATLDQRGRHAAQPEDFLWRYRVLIWRRLLSEVLKDLLARRWDFPQFRGVLVVMREWRKLWDRDVSELDNWYPAFQRTILEEL